VVVRGVPRRRFPLPTREKLRDSRTRAPRRR
jgi:hypothetical protein